MSTHKRTWIVTYSDMVTLLMAFFVSILAFSPLAGSRQRVGLERDAVVWRPRLPSRISPSPQLISSAEGAISGEGDDRAALEPLYRQPSPETRAHILQALDDATRERPARDFTVRLPLGLLFEKDEQLSCSGMRLLHAVAEQLRQQPYDLQFQVERSEDTGRAVALCHFLLSREEYEPARLAVGARPEPADEDDFVWLALCRQE